MMLPLLDLVNHGDGDKANAEIIMDANGDLYMYAKRDIAAGEEVHAFSLISCWYSLCKAEAFRQCGHLIYWYIDLLLACWCRSFISTTLVSAAMINRCSIMASFSGRTPH